jgi:dTDP-4-amino-4,6-dideoxygalactose transaminase
MKIPFEPEYRERYYALLDELFDSNFLSEGPMVERFEGRFGACVGGLKATAVSNCGMGLLSVLEFVGVRGHEVIVPSNTFMATALAVRHAGADVVYADCNRKDLCLSLEDLKKRITRRTKAVILVHIGGHLAFQSQEIADFLAEQGIALIEDCAHAHGAHWNDKSAGSFGLAGVYSFYATKTMPLGEGGMVVTNSEDVDYWVRKYRNYGKFEYKIPGMNCRMNEVTAALGLVQMDRLPVILEWKRALAKKYDGIFENRVRFPQGMVSGYYKYIVFDTNVTEKTGAVFDRLCHEIEGIKTSLPHSEWIRDHHCCPPIYFGWDGADLSMEELSKRLIGKR